MNHSWSSTSVRKPTFIWIRAGRHAVHSLSHSTIGWHGLKRKTEQQRIGRETAESRGKQWGLMNYASTISGYRSAVGETAVPYFLADRPSWKIPHEPQVHQFIWVLRARFPVSTMVILHVIWFEFDSVLSIKSGAHTRLFYYFDTCHYFHHLCLDNIMPCWQPLWTHPVNVLWKETKTVCLNRVLGYQKLPEQLHFFLFSHTCLNLRDAKWLPHEKFHTFGVLLMKMESSVSDWA